MLQNTAISLDSNGLADSLHRHHDRDLLGFGNLVQIDVQDFAAEGMVLDLLHQDQSLRLCILGHGQIEEQVFRDRMVDQFLERDPIDLEIFRLSLTPVNDSRHPASGTEFFHSAPPGQ